MRLVALLFALFACTAQAALPEPVAKALKSAGIPEDSVAVYARRLDADLPVIAEHSEQAMNPASVMKLVTTYAGLELLGPSYTWRTAANQRSNHRRPHPQGLRRSRSHIGKILEPGARIAHGRRARNSR
jgi:D-alanyl-D-alanine carboxypeptidase